MIDVILTTYQGAILGPVARLLGYILQGIYQLLSIIGIENTGVCMILFTFIVNGLMFPMQLKTQKFSRMSSIMKPEIDAIQKKYKNKKDTASQQQMSLETQAVYQKYGVSPTSGCLPMLITFPIMLALYRVIYNFPAYVPQVYDIYKDLAAQIQGAGIKVKDLSEMVSASTYVVTDAVNRSEKISDISKVDLGYYIDILGQFNADAWQKLQNFCTKTPQPYTKEISAIIQNIPAVAEKSDSINIFLGLNMADKPKWNSVSVIIPVLSVVTQMISTKLNMANSPQQMDPENPTMASMKMMNTFMPFMTGFMCFIFPIGVCLYWVAGSVFRIFQAIGIRLYFNRIDINEEIAKNVEKVNKKYERMGIDPHNLQNVAKTRTSTIDAANSLKKNTSHGNVKKDYKRNENTKYKKGSIAAYANMMSRDDK